MNLFGENRQQEATIKYETNRGHFKTSFYNIDSRERTLEEQVRQTSTRAFSESHFRVELPNKIPDVVSLKINSVEFFNVFDSYNDFRQNNFFTVVTPNSSYVVKISDGGYNKDTIVQEISNKLTAINTTSGLNLVAIVTLGGYFMIASSNSSIFSLNFSNQANNRNIYSSKNNYQSLGYQLGFRTESLSGQNAYSGLIPLSPDPDTYLFIRFNNYVNFPWNSVPRIFAKLRLCDKGKFDLHRDIVQENAINAGVLGNSGKESIGYFDVVFLDYRGNKINTNSDFTITFEIVQKI